MIKKGSVVNLSYILKDETGEILDQSTSGRPFYYLHGFGNIIPGLEQGLEGLSIGNKKSIQVEPHLGYGERDENLVMRVPLHQFPKDVTLELGMQFQSQGPAQEPVIFEVVELADDSAVVDGNHPMAGRNLNFDVEVLEIREASTEELSHGHVHGPHGHHH